MGSGFNANLNNITTDKIIYSAYNSAYYIAGYFTSYKGASYTRLIAINTSGNVISGFNSTNINDGITDMTISATNNQKLFICGLFTNYKGNTNYTGIVKINLDASIDTTYKLPLAFINTYKSSGSNNLYMGNVLSLTSGKVMFYLQSYGIGCTDSVGNIDSSFIRETYATNSVEIIMLEVENGKILVADSAINNYLSSGKSKCIRLNADGTVDTTFDVSNKILNLINTNGNPINIEYISSSEYNIYNGKYAIKYNPITDEISELYNIVPITSYTTSVIKYNNSTKKIIIGGWFTAYNGQNVNRIVCVNPHNGLSNTIAT